MKMMLVGTALTLLVSVTPRLAKAENAVTAGAFTVDRPTLVSLGFEWRIAGDGNRNASVAVFYRKKGETKWRSGLPMLRLDGEQVDGGFGGTGRSGGAGSA